jgi:hypothetical protein
LSGPCAIGQGDGRQTPGDQQVRVVEQLVRRGDRRKRQAFALKERSEFGAGMGL